MSKSKSENSSSPSTSFFQNAAAKLFGFDKLVHFYQDQPWPADPGEFCQIALERFGIRLEVNPEELKAIPKQGPLVAVSNHPFGAIEGIILGALLRSVRPDVKIIANGILAQIRELQDLFIFVDPFETRRSRRTNIRPVRESIRWLKEDRALAMFPAGEVSHRSWTHWRIVDPLWNDSAAKMVRAAKASVVPIFFEGTNGTFFQLAGLVHPGLRTAMLARELWHRRNQTLRVHVGAPLPYSHFASDWEDEKLTQYLRLRTYFLGKRMDQNNSHMTHTSGQVIVDPLPRERLLKAMKNLPAEQNLGGGHGCSIYYFRKHQAEDLMHEIGRLREITFRGANEGTGKSIDIDNYDDTYFHLFVWHEEAQEMVGAYRLGPTDEILPKAGIQGLYTHSLFRYAPELIPSLTPGLEMGRSFVAPQYQRHFWSLSLLWKGIGQFISRFPRYRYLFGPVSISSGYSEYSRNLMVRFLKRFNFRDDLAQYVHPLQPPDFNPVLTQDGQDPLSWVNNTDDLSNLIADVEPVFKGIPILLKHYLNLGAVHLGFNIDPEFNDALDGLILVDLVTGAQKTVKRFMGNEGYEKFCAYHAGEMPAESDSNQT